MFENRVLSFAECSRHNVSLRRFTRTSSSTEWHTRHTGPRDKERWHVTWLMTLLNHRRLHRRHNHLDLCTSTHPPTQKLSALSLLFRSAGKSPHFLSAAFSHFSVGFVTSLFLLMFFLRKKKPCHLLPQVVGFFCMPTWDKPYQISSPAVLFCLLGLCSKLVCNFWSSVFSLSNGTLHWWIAFLFFVKGRERKITLTIIYRTSCFSAPWPISWIRACN